MQRQSIRGLANLLCYDISDTIKIKGFLQNSHLIKKPEIYLNSADKKTSVLYQRFINNYNRTDNIVYKDGINILYESRHNYEEGLADFDVVLIHGLRGNFYTTWRVE